MGPFLRYCVWSERDAFLDDLRPKYIIPSLIKDKVLTYADSDDVLAEKTPKLQVLRLIDILGKKGSIAFDAFVNALYEDDAYPWLADKLVEKKKKNNYDGKDVNSEEMHRQLAIGGVPFQTNYFFKREAVLFKIQTELLKAVEERRWWVVLHGMLGCGKSVLAAEAVRDSHIFTRCFPNGIFWIPVGSIQDKVENTLLHKLQTLWEHLERSHTYLAENREVLFMNPDINKVKRHLKAIFADPEKSKFLIILDDVCEHSVVDAFDIGCPVMVTTRNIDVVKSVSAYASLVALDEGLNLEEACKFLSQYVKVDPGELPSTEMKVIHSKSKGLPLTLSLIGAMMLPFGNKLKRWQHLKETMEQGKSLESARNRHSSGNSLQVKDMIDMSINSLDDTTKELYFDFAIFEEDVFVPTKVFEIMWDKDTIYVEDTMFELYQKSLVCFEEDPESDSYMYCVHDLYLQHLKDTCARNQDLEGRHKKLVECYLKLCEVLPGSYNFGLLPNDGYIHYYIGHHIIRANLVEYFSKMFLDFNFIQNKLRFAGSSDLLFDFTTYRAYFVEVLTEMTDIESFIRRNAHLLCNKDADIIQLALFEPTNSTVHVKAKRASLANGKKIHFEWSNQNTVPYLSILNIKLGFDDLRCIAFSPSDDIVASVGNDKTVMLWDSTSGKEFDKLSGHFGPVNCCSFNARGTCLATASDDGTVRLWDIDPTYISRLRGSKTKRSSQLISIPDIVEYNFESDPSVFTNHQTEVSWCSFSPDSKLVISGDNSGTVYVWEVESKHVKYQFSHYHSDLQHSIICCHFLKDQQFVATAANSSIKIWNIINETCVNTLVHKDELLVQFRFSHDSKYLYSVTNANARKWDVKTLDWSVFSSSTGKSFFLCCCDLSPDGLYLASGTSNFSVVVWNTVTMKCIANLRGHKNAVQSVSYSLNGLKLVSASCDGHVIIWDMKDCVATSMISLENNLSVKYAGDLIVASSDHLNRIQIRSGLNGILTHKSEPDFCDITCCSLSADCSEVIYGTKIGSVKVFMLKYNATNELPPHRGSITYLTHINNSFGFISCSEDYTIRVWNERKEFFTLKGHSQAVSMCVLYESGKKMLSCSEDGTLRVWDLDLKKAVMVLEGHGNQKVNFCDVSPCEKFLCSASSDCTIKIWNAQHGEEIKVFQCRDCVRCCCFSPLPNVIVSGDDSGEVKMWYIDESKPSPVLLGSHDLWVKAIKFSRDGTQFVTVADSIKLWAEDGSLAQTIVLPGDFCCALWASSDFKTFVLIHNSVLYILKTVS